MPGFAKQFALQTYVDDNGVSWNKRGPIGTGSFASAVDGHAPAGANLNVWQDTKRRQSRHVIYQDPTTFRTYRALIYTQTAFSLIHIQDIIAVEIPGEVAAVNYFAVQKVPERQPGQRPSRNDPQHA